MASVPSVPYDGAAPAFFRVSTTKDPTNKNITIITNNALVFVYTSVGGGPLGVSQAPTGVFSPFYATWTFAQIPYPTVINVNVLDAASHQSIGQHELPLFGGDVFKCVVVYPTNIPAANGWINAMVDGFPQSVYGQDYLQQDFYHDDIYPRGTD